MLNISSARKYMCLWMSIGLALFLSACGEAEPTPSQMPSMMSAQTQEPASIFGLGSSSTPFPTAQFSPTMTFPPLTEIAVQPLTPLPSSAPICEGAPNTRMIVGARGRVGSQDMRPLNVRASSGTEGRILGRLEVGDLFQVLDGPECRNGFVWYYIERLDGSLRGWVAEGEVGFYYIEPYLIG
jgi:hypothetical protein